MSAGPFLLLAVCDISVTNVGKAACAFCDFLPDGSLAGPARYLDVGKFELALVAAGIRQRSSPTAATLNLLPPGDYDSSGISA